VHVASFQLCHCKFVEVGTFPGLNSTGVYTGWRSDFTVAGTASEFRTYFPPCISVLSLQYHLLSNFERF